MEGEGSSHLPAQQTIRYPGLLLADELVPARATDFARDKLLQLIEGREGLKLPTLFTSNLPLTSRAGECVAAELGSRIASRLEGGMVVEWRGKDRRRRRRGAA